MEFDSALITGASRGIGAAFARALPPTTDLLLAGRDAEALAALKAELDAASEAGRQVETAAGDLRREADRGALIRRAEAMEIDLLINNAGAGAFGAVLENDPDEERGAVEVNVLTPVVLTRALLPGMLSRARREHRKAGLVNVASAMAFQPWPYLATYAASKSFLLSWTEALAAELRWHPVAVLAYCPRLTSTEFGRRAGFAEAWPSAAAEPEDVAHEGLEALGRHTVYVGGAAARTALTPFLLPRHLATSGLGLAMGLFGRGSRRPQRAARSPRGRSPTG